MQETKACELEALKIVHIIFPHIEAVCSGLSSHPYYQDQEKLVVVSDSFAKLQTEYQNLSDHPKTLSEVLIDVKRIEYDIVDILKKEMYVDTNTRDRIEFLSACVKELRAHLIKKTEKYAGHSETAGTRKKIKKKEPLGMIDNQDISRLKNQSLSFMDDRIVYFEKTKVINFLITYVKDHKLNQTKMNKILSLLGTLSSQSVVETKNYWWFVAYKLDYRKFSEIIFDINTILGVGNQYKKYESAFTQGISKKFNNQIKADEVNLAVKLAVSICLSNNLNATKTSLPAAILDIFLSTLENALYSTGFSFFMAKNSQVDFEKILNFNAELKIYLARNQIAEKCSTL